MSVGSGPALNGDTPIQVYNADMDTVITVSAATAFEGMLAYGRSLGEPSPAAAVAIGHAMDFGRAHGLWPTS